MSDQQEKPKTGKEKASWWLHHGPCPARSCKHSPIDHRPVSGAAKNSHFCYAEGCMETCTPAVRGIKARVA